MSLIPRLCPTLPNFAPTISEMIVNGRWPGSRAKLSAVVLDGQCTVTANDDRVLVMNIAAAKSAPDNDEYTPAKTPIIPYKSIKVKQLVWTKTGPHIEFGSASTAGTNPEFWMVLNIDQLESAEHERPKRKTMCDGFNSTCSSEERIDYTQVAGLMFLVIDEDFAVEVPIGPPKNFNDLEAE